jgi:dihydroorotate dehydrogenase electron transfer subunit
VIELFIKPIGPGSRLVAESERDQPLEILGPLGRPFTHFGKAPVLLVGGGYGAAPLLFLAERYHAKKAGSRIKLLFGGRCQTDLVLLRDFKQQGIALACATEDGSHGQSGRVTALLEAELSKAKVPPVIQAAGPWGMLQAVAGLAARFHCQAEVSVEETMACGLGICNGCAVSVAGKYQRACQDGPVFPADQVNWEARHGH